MTKSTTTEAPYPYNLVDEILQAEAPERALADSTHEVFEEEEGANE